MRSRSSPQPSSFVEGKIYPEVFFFSSALVSLIDNVIYGGENINNNYNAGLLLTPTQT